MQAFMMSLAVFITLLVGLSRVYLGVHWPTDVLAGWCIGSSWALLCGAIALWLRSRGVIEAVDATARERPRGSHH